MGINGKVVNGSGKVDDDDEFDVDSKKLRGVFVGVILMDKLNIKWEDVVGLEGVKDVLKEVVILFIKFLYFFIGKR